MKKVGELELAISQNDESMRKQINELQLELDGKNCAKKNNEQHRSASLIQTKQPKSIEKQPRGPIYQSISDFSRQMNSQSQS